MRFRKVYLEISNICNLSCAFCPGTRRQKRAMTEEDLAVLLPKLRPYADFLYFHLMGEPLCHPKLAKFLEMAGNHGFRVILTTNGTLLSKRQEMLLNSPALHKVNISLHAFEANDLSVPFEEYLSGCFNFGKAAEGKVLVSYRLWNHGGQEEKNGQILSAMESYFPQPWVQDRHGQRIGNRVFLEYGDKFDWPDLSAHDGGASVFCHGLRDQIGILADGTVVPCCLDHEGDIALGNLFEQTLEEILEYGDKFDWPDLSAHDGGASVFCHGLRDQIGILADGTVVPCCLDHEGDIALGNLFEQTLDVILESPRAKALYEGFSCRKATEELCRRCGYARRFG